MTDFNYKRVTDSVHGTIGLSELETKVIGAQAFLRLQNVRHLGLAYQVFPGALYSRFSHSLGACHIMGRMLSQLSTIESLNIDEHEIERFRLAALLHDCGHYPLSHPTEHAIKEHYVAKTLLRESEKGGATPSTTEKTDTDGEDDSKSPYYKHERVGQLVLSTDPELLEILRKHFDPEEISRTFLREDDSQLVNLVSSDLDVDRIDYLLRTAGHTGLPYGSPDIEYMITQLDIDSDGKICLNKRALGTADHYLLSRYFDYRQVTRHKSIVALEWAYKEVVKILLQRNEEPTLGCSPNDIKNMICSGKWRSFDDNMIFTKMRELRGCVSGVDLLKVESVLDRRPAKLVGERSLFESRDVNKFTLYERVLNDNYIPRWSEQFDIPKESWWVWTDPLILTKLGASTPSRSQDPESSEEAIRILTSGRKSVPIMETGGSLMKLLSGNALHEIRVYVLLVTIPKRVLKPLGVVERES